MAEAKDTSPASAGPKRSGGGFELRLERGGAYVRLVEQPVAPGIRLDALTLQIPDVKFPFDVGQGAGQFRHRLADLVDLSVAIDPSAAEEALAAAGLAAFGVEDTRIAARDGFVEIAGRLSGGPPFTLEAGLLPAGERGLSLVFHSPRVLGLAPIPAAALPHLARSALDAVGPDAVPREPLAPLLRRLLAPRGWKLPRLGEARLARATISDGVARLVWDRAAAGPAATSADPDLLAADEGAHTFREAEALVARGDWAGAREAYLAADGAAAHPFAAERLLALLAHEERFHEDALDLAAEWLSRRPGFGAALAAEGNVRLARGEEARAARAFAALAEAAAERGRSFLALAAAEAAFARPAAAPEDALRAVEVALRVRRDHVPALRALRTIARAGGDREALLRANRRLVAYDEEPASKARAHAELGELLLEADPPGARLHLDHALRLAPDDTEALAALARACASAGEPLRAVRALDRLKELLLARGERVRAAQSALQAGELWEEPLGHSENALLRYREAAELAPGADTHARAADAAERAGQWAEAADHHAAVLAALDPSDARSAALAVRTRVALADVAERLGDAAAAAAHLEKAVALEPDAVLLRRLAELQGHGAGRMAALDRLAPLEQDPAARALLLAEAAEEAAALGLAGDAQARFTAAAAAHAACRPALLGLARLARERGDPIAERDALERLLPLSAPGSEAADVLDRIAHARERAGDLGGALEAAAAARQAAPTLARLEIALRLARGAGDDASLAALLAERAQAAAAAGDVALATDAWLERSRLLAPGSPAEALAAVAEARAVSPGHSAVLSAQAELAERTGDHRLALACVRALLAGAPEDAPLLEVRAARAALAAGEAQAAKDHAERAYSRGVPGAAEVLDEILDRAGDDAARADVLTRLGRHLEAARLFERHGDAARARAAFERAAGDPACAAEALPSLADLRLADGDRAGAGAALLALARLAEGREAARIALRAHSAGRDVAALDVAVEKDPRFAPARARRAALRAREDPGGALADAEAALSGDELPDGERAGLLALAAGAAAASGDGRAARRHLSGYCELVRDDDAALARLAALHRAAGAPEDLARVLEQRLSRAPDDEAAQVRLELSDLLAAHDPARAAQLALEALEHAPASVEALRAVTTAPRAAHVPPAVRASLLARIAANATATPEEAIAALGARARLLTDAGDTAAALAALRDAARLGPEPDDVLELHARLAEAAGDGAEAARALLERARLARDRQEPAAAERLADAGLQALAAGVDGGEEALRAALALGPERDTARAALEALVRRARERGDAAAEREALPLLVPLLPTGARPAALLRLAALALEANNPVLARASAEEARALAPRDLAAVEACRAAALVEGDLAAVAALLAEAAHLDPPSAGKRLLDRARLLLALRRPQEADDAYSAALAALPPDRALADEQARLRRGALPGRAASEPIETFALRAADERAGASALRAAAALALSAGDLPAALRCARRAYARTQRAPAFAAPLLARVLYLMGGADEALVLHRRLLEAGFPGVAPEEAIALCRQAADLAEAAGEREVALQALDELLRLRPQEIDAALLRFDLERDRARAVRDLAQIAEACRSQRRRALALTRAAEAAMEELQDRDLATRLFRRARQEADRAPALELAVARRRAEAMRRAEGSSPAFLEALHAAAATAQAAGDRAAARDLLEEAIARERERALFGEAARDLLHLDALAAADGDLAGSPARFRAAAALQREAGDLPGATETLRRAYQVDPGDDETFARLEDVLRARGAEGAPLLLELLAERAAHCRPGPQRADALVRVADAHRAAGDLDRAEAALRSALAEVPNHGAAEDRFLALLAQRRRTGERARLLLERSARLPDGEASLALRREAAAALAASTDAQDRDLAAETWRTVAAARPSDLEAARSAAGLLIGLGRRGDAIPHLAALVRADLDDDAAAAELARAYADRPLDLAELFVARAARVSGTARSARLREAAAAFFSAGEDARARAALRDAFEAWPGDDAAFAEALRAAASDLDRVGAVLSARASAVPEDAAACHRARADALQATGRMEEAIEAYEAAVAADPEDAALAAMLAACLADARGDAAAAALDRWILARADQEPGEVPTTAEAASRFRIGLALSFAGKVVECVSYLERAVSLAPFDAHAGLAWAALAQGHAARGDAVGALAAARARIERATALRLEEEKRAALEAEAELTAQLGLPSALGASEIEAQRRAAQGPASSPEATRSVEDWIETADALERAGAPAEEVRATLGSACQAHPDSPVPWRALARLEAARGDPLAAARAHFSASIRGEGDDASRSALEAARLFEESGRHADAARSYRAAVLARPGAVPTAVLLAAEALAAGELEAAVRHLSSLAISDLPAEMRAVLPAEMREALERARPEGPAARRTDLEAEALPQDLGARVPEAPEARVEEHFAFEAQGDAQAEGEPQPERILLEEAAAVAPDAEPMSEPISFEAAEAAAPDAEPPSEWIVEEAAAVAPDAEPMSEPISFEAAAGFGPDVEPTPEPTALETAGPVAPDAELPSEWIVEAAADVAPDAEPTSERILLEGAAAAAPDAEPASEPPAPEAAAAASPDTEPTSEHILFEAAAAVAPEEEELTFEDIVDATAPGAELASEPPAFETAAAVAPDVEPAPEPTAPETAAPLTPDSEPTPEPTAPEAAAPLAPDVEPTPEPIDLEAAAAVAPDSEPMPAPTALEASAPGPEPAATEEPPSSQPPPGAAAAPWLDAPDGLSPDAPIAPWLDVPDSASPETPIAPWLDAPDGPLPEVPIAFELDLTADDAAEAAAVAGKAPPAAPAGPQELARAGRALMEQGDLAGAYDRLSLALSGEPSDLTIARDLSRLAEKLGLHEKYVQLGEVCADAIAAYDPLAAAARYRHFATVLREKMASPSRAAVMLEKALSLVPDDPDTRRELIAVWADRPETAPRALDAWLELARKDPSDAVALATVASLCERIAAGGGDAAAGLPERGRIAASIAAFLSTAHAAPPPARVATHVPAELRARVAAPGAVGPLAQLLRLLTPWLETLFPADLRRRGASADDRLDAERAPAVAAALESASRALQARTFAAFLPSRPGVDAALENTLPPSVVLGGGVAVLDDAALSFLAARTLDLLDHGWCLVGKFAPKDIAILLELACRFAGGEPPSLGLPPERAGAFLAVLESQVPPEARAAAREIGAAAAQELAESDPRAFVAALRRTANRVALLYGGDPGAALRTLALLDRRLGAGPLDAAQALALPDLRDVALFALSDPFLELRAATLGYTTAP